MYKEKHVSLNPGQCVLQCTTQEATTMVVSIRMTEEEKLLADAYAKLHGISLSEAIKRAYFEKIEEEFDIAVMESALKEYKSNSKTYSLEEVKKALDL